MASEVGKTPLTGVELIERASEFCGQVYGRLTNCGVVDPRPRHFVLAAIAEQHLRVVEGLEELPPEVVVTACWYLVPPYER